MKKHYEAPAIVYEDFSLSASIAAGCELITKMPSEGVCGYPTTTGSIIWNVGQASNCDIGPSGKYDQICYHNPSDWEKNLFSSL